MEIVVIDKLKIDNFSNFLRSIASLESELLEREISYSKFIMETKFLREYEKLQINCGHFVIQ